MLLAQYVSLHGIVHVTFPIEEKCARYVAEIVVGGGVIIDFTDPDRSVIEMFADPVGLNQNFGVIV